MSKTLYSILAIAFLTLAGCKSADVAGGKANKRASARSIAKAHQDNALDFETIKSRLGIRYQDDGQSVAATLDLRMKKDEHIWMSAKLLGFTVAKVHITPQRVRFYEKKDKQYFDGDFALISEFLGQRLDFTQMQNLLLGQAVENLEDCKVKVVDNEYRLTEKGIIDKLFRLRPTDFKLLEQSAIKESENSSLQIRYPEYQEVENKVLPREIFVLARRNDKFSQVELEFKSVRFNEELNFPFEFPDGYTKMEL
jgi:outer membrane biogenesis lipoprotein LolB